MQIRGLRLFGHHGVSAEERRRGQFFLVDADVEVERPSQQDELAETVDYTLLIEAMRAQSESHPYRLLESVAHALAEVLLQRFPRVRRARVRVRKRWRGSQGELEWVAVEVAHAREEHPIGG
jgi:dihydroneopterin aldolase